MKKNNKNGFAITELLAVTVVIMVIFTTIYSNFFVFDDSGNAKVVCRNYDYVA